MYDCIMRTLIIAEKQGRSSSFDALECIETEDDKFYSVDTLLDLQVRFGVVCKVLLVMLEQPPSARWCKSRILLVQFSGSGTVKQTNCLEISICEGTPVHLLIHDCDDSMLGCRIDAVSRPRLHPFTAPLKSLIKAAYPF